MSLYDSLHNPPPYRDTLEHPIVVDKSAVTMSKSIDLFEVPTAPPTQRQNLCATIIIAAMAILNTSFSFSLIFLYLYYPKPPPWWSPWITLSCTVIAIITNRISLLYPNTRWALHFQFSHDLMLFTNGTTAVWSVFLGLYVHLLRALLR
ncbi:hypothetical protein BKA81DRAFT_53329 [Phyllosticta paracitricarpa]|uniref:Transmembrane protein n=1 Tax=Phyllosticta citricarpa TaxID=55181 RepID=A0ABR1MKY0_9PEZI